MRSIDGGLLGPEHLILSLGCELEERGVRFVLANLWDGRPARVALHDEAIRRGLESHVVRLAWGTDPSAVWRLLRLIRQVHPDVVYTHDQKSEISALLATRLTPTPMVGGYYGRLAIRSRRIKLQEATSFVSFRFFSRVLANSQAQARELIQWRLPREHIAVVPSFVNTRALRPPSPDEVLAARQLLDIAPDQRVVTTVARLSAQKGHTYMLAALDQLRRSVPDVLYLVVGDSDANWHGEGLRDLLVRQVADLGLSAHVRFLGQRGDLETILHATDVLVSPSLREGMSVVLLDAMSAGLPVVATSVGGSPEVVLDGQTGALVPPGDASALAAAVLALLVDPARRDAWGRAGRRRVEQRFDTRVVAGQVLDLCVQAVRRA